MTFQLPAGVEQVTGSNAPSVEYGGPRIPGAITSQSSTDACAVLVQEIPHELYKITYHVFHFFKKLCLEYSSQNEGLHTHASLENNTRHTFEGIGKMNVLEGQYAAFCGNDVRGRTRFDENAHYRIFDISYSPGFAAEVADAFPRCAEAINAGKAVPLSKNPQSLNVAMRECIHSVLKCKFNDASRALYLDAKVREYLVLALHNIYDVPKPNYRFSPADLEKILEAKRLLLHDISKAGYQIKELAAAVGLNEFRLKTGFKFFFHCGIFETLRQTRMETAKELLLNTTMSMKEIASLTGYPRISNFMTTFTKFFGYPAGSVRKK